MPTSGGVSAVAVVSTFVSETTRTDIKVNSVGIQAARRAAHVKSCYSISIFTAQIQLGHPQLGTAGCIYFQTTSASVRLE